MKIEFNTDSNLFYILIFTYMKNLMYVYIF